MIVRWGIRGNLHNRGIILIPLYIKRCGISLTMNPNLVTKKYPIENRILVVIFIYANLKRFSMYISFFITF